MKITKEMLKSKSPCKEGYIWFLEKYGNEAKVELKTLLKDAPREHSEWIRKYLVEAVSIEYDGDFKFGDIVYISLEQLGTYHRGKITYIKKAGAKESGNQFLIGISTGCGSSSYEKIEYDVFNTLASLKNHWRRIIAKAKDYGIEENI